MPRSKFKLTGFARFFIAMLFLAPLAYIGASYYNGEDGIKNIKNFFQGLTGGGSTDSETKSMEHTETTTDDTQNQEDVLEEKRRLEEEIRKKNEQIEALNKKLEEQ